MLRRPVAASVAIVLSGCGAATASAPRATPLPPLATPAPPARPPLVAIIDGNARMLRLVGLDGAEVASAVTSDSFVRTTVAGAGLLFVDGHLVRSLQRDGTVQEVGSLRDSLGGIVASPDGDQWIWSEETSPTSDVYTTRVVAGGRGAAPHLIATHKEPLHWIAPLAWTEHGVVVDHVPGGIGGRPTFPDDTVFATSHLDPTAGDLSDFTSESCRLLDVRKDGTVLCRRGGAGTPVVLSIQAPGGRGRDVTFPGDVVDIGRARPVPGTTVEGFGVARRGSSADDLAYQTLTIGLAGGAPHPFGPLGLEPLQWLSDGRLVAIRPNAVGGDPGTYLVAADGVSTTKLSAIPDAVAVLE
jgi:hypothetical protein